MPVRATPQSATQKWLSGISSSTQRITDGVNRVATAPGQQAAAQKNAYLQGVNSSVDKWAANTAAVSLQQWQQSTIAAIPNIASGASRKQAKMLEFQTAFLPFMANGVAQIDRMPKGGLQNGIARAVAMMQYTATFKKH